LPFGCAIFLPVVFSNSSGSVSGTLGIDANCARIFAASSLLSAMIFCASSLSSTDGARRKVNSKPGAEVVLFVVGVAEAGLMCGAILGGASLLLVAIGRIGGAILVGVGEVSVAVKDAVFAAGAVCAPMLKKPNQRASS
jgi:hypothetical protein